MNEYLTIFGDVIRLATFQPLREPGRYEPERNSATRIRRPRNTRWRGR